MRPHRWERVLSHQGTRRTDTKHQECCATITQILPPTLPQPHVCAEGVEFLISVVNVSSLISEYKLGV